MRAVHRKRGDVIEKAHPQTEQIQQLPVDELYPFVNHPFKVQDDEAMAETVESISQRGILSPLIARPRPDGDGYEIISGHRRQYAAKKAGLDTVPVIVRNMTDLFFEFFVVNYRPVLIEGVLEASYPSSTTMLMMCIMPTAIMQFHHLISSKRLRNIVNAFCGIYASFMVIGRVLSGVHWFTDIVGGILLSATLVMLYYSTNQLVNSKASRSSQRSR